MKPILILAFLLNFSCLLAKEPVTQVPPIPPDNQLEMYEDSEGLFAIMVMDYYAKAVALRTQLQIEDPVAPVYPLFAPTTEEMEDMDIKLIKRYHDTAASYERRVRELPGTGLAQCRKQMQDTILALTKKYLKEQADCSEKLVKSTVGLENDCIRRVKELENEILKKSKYTSNSLFVTVTENFFLSNSEGKLEALPSIGVQVGLNAYKLLGFWRSLEFWYEYIAPRFKTITDYVSENNSISFTEQWNSHMHSAGLSFNLGPVIHTKYYSDGFRLAGGYFWTTGTIYNRSNGFYQWDGLRADLKYFISAPELKAPLEVIFGISLYHSFNNNLVFNTETAGIDPVDIGRTHFNLSFGLRLKL